MFMFIWHVREKFSDLDRSAMRKTLPTRGLGYLKPFFDTGR